MIRRPRLSRRAMTFATLLLGAVSWGGGAGADVRPLTTLGGFRGSAASSGLHVTYNPKGLLPTGAPVDLGSPDALATISSGPVTFARAAIADPGDLLANPDALLSQANTSYPSGTIPSWPLRITASSSIGEPVAEQNTGPGLSARVEANKDGSRSTASMPGTELPAIVSVSSVVSDAWTKTDGSTVTLRARVRSTGFDLLGLVKIDAIVSDFTGVSDGALAKFSGVTTVTGATVMGRKVSIDSDGVEARAKDAPDLNAILSQAGIKVTLAKPFTAKSGAGGMREGAGLRIDLEFSANTLPVLNGLLDALPPLDSPIPGAPGIEDLIAVARARHTVAIHLAGAAVSVDARPSAVFAAPVTDLGGDEDFVPSVASGGFDFPATSPLLPEPAAPRALPPETHPASSSSPAPLGRGIGGFLLLALLTQPFIGYRLARGSAALLGGAAPDCTEEEL